MFSYKMIGKFLRFLRNKIPILNNYKIILWQYTFDIFTQTINLGGTLHQEMKVFYEVNIFLST